MRPGTALNLTALLAFTACADNTQVAARASELTLARPLAWLSIDGEGVVQAGSCARFDLAGYVTNPNGTSSRVTAPEDLPIALSSTAGSLFADARCALALGPSAVIEAGSRSASVWLRVATPQAVTLDAAALGLSATRAVSVEALGPAVAVALTGPSTVVTGVSCLRYVAGLRDAHGWATTSPGPLTLGFSNDGAGAFFTDRLCTTRGGSATVAAGGGSAGMWFRDEVVESVTLRATGQGLADGVREVRSTRASRLALTGASVIGRGQCAPYVLRSQDEGGAAVGLSADTTVSLTGSGAGRFSDLPDCSTIVTAVPFRAGRSSVRVYFTDAVSEALTLRAAAPAFEEAASLPVAVASPSRLSVTGPASIDEGVCAPYAVTLQGSAGTSTVAVSAVTALAITLSQSLTGSLYAADGCAGPAVTATSIPAGASSVTVWLRQATVAAPDGYDLNRLSAADPAGALAAGSKSVTVVARAVPTYLSLAGPAVGAVGVPTVLTVAMRTVGGALTTRGLSTSVALSSTGAERFYNEGCTSPLTGERVSIPAGQSSVRVCVSREAIDAPTLGARATYTTTAGAITLLGSLGIRTRSRTLVGGPASTWRARCTPYSLHLPGVLPPTAPQSVTVTLTASASAPTTHVGFYSDPACATAVTTVDLTAGSTVGFFAESSRADTLVLRGTVASDLIDAEAYPVTALELPGSITVTPATATLVVGQQQSFGAAGNFSGERRDVTDACLWRSSVPSVASVTEGVASALSAGQATMECSLSTRSYAGPTGAATVTVTSPTVGCGSGRPACSAGQVCAWDTTCLTPCSAGGPACPSGTTCAGPTGGSYCVGTCGASLPACPTNWSCLTLGFCVPSSVCGALPICGTACCALGQVCTAGACVSPTCPAGQAYCAGACVDILANSASCGGCGVTCGAGQTCQAGACVTPCGAGQSRCGGVCRYLGSDPANCGVCGQVCGAGRVCSIGMCAVGCAAHLTACSVGGGTVCTNLAIDRDNCGACGTRCAAGEACVRPFPGSPPACAATRCPGMPECGEICRDHYNDRAHCGGCGITCGANQYCSMGHCQLSPGDA